MSLADQKIDLVRFARIVRCLLSCKDRKAAVDALRANTTVKVLLGHLPRAGATRRITEQLAAAGISVNIAGLVASGQARAQSMSLRGQHPSAAELARMRAVVAAAMDDGLPTVIGVTSSGNRTRLRVGRTMKASVGGEGGAVGCEGPDGWGSAVSALMSADLP